MVFKDFARIRFPLEIGERADESVPFVKRASLNASFQWKLGLSKIQMFSGVRKALFSIILMKGAFYAEISVRLRTHPPFPLELTR